MAEAVLTPGTVFAGYTVHRVVGSGATGTVYAAADPSGRRVALKLLHPDLTGGHRWARFESEAAHIARLEHPGIVTAHHTGRLGTQLWLALPYLAAASAAELVRTGGGIAPQQAVRIVRGAAEALDHAHERGVLHRDLKPANVFVDSDRVLLTDFAIVTTLAENPQLPRAAALPGAAHYAAPEQLTGAALDERTDVYALGCTLFHLLVGRPPYPQTSLAELTRAHLQHPIPHAGTGGLGPDWGVVFDRALAKEPSHRYPSCGALAADAAAALAGHASFLPPEPEPEPFPEQPDEAAPAPVVLLPPMPDPPVRLPTPPRIRQPGPPPAWWQDRRLQLAGAALAVVAVVITAVVSYAALAGRPSAEPQTHGAPSSRQQQATETVLGFTDFMDPAQVAVDREGAVYVADPGLSQVVKLGAGSTTQVTLPFTGLAGVSGVAVDADGNVYAADTGNHRVLKLAAGRSVDQELPFTGLDSPTALAVDSGGALYLTDTGTGRVVKLPAGSSTPQTLPFTDLRSPTGVAVDATGTVYVVDYGDDRVVKLATGSAVQRDVAFTGLHGPSGIAVDADGNVYLADTGNARVLKLTGSGDQQELPFTDLQGPSGVAVDADGDVFVSDDGERKRVFRLAPG